MKKRIRRRPPDEIKMIVTKKLDEMEHTKTSDSQRKIWERKPYDFRGKDEV